MPFARPLPCPSLALFHALRSPASTPFARPLPRPSLTLFHALRTPSSTPFTLTLILAPGVQAIWANEIEAIVTDAFKRIAGRHDAVGAAGRLQRHVDAMELETWLNLPIASPNKLPLKSGHTPRRRLQRAAEVDPIALEAAKQAAQKAHVARMLRSRPDAIAEGAMAAAAAMLHCDGFHRERPLPSWAAAPSRRTGHLVGESTPWVDPLPQDTTSHPSQRLRLIPPLNQLPPLPSPRSPRSLSTRPSPRGAGRVRIKPTIHPIRPLDLPFRIAPQTPVGTRILRLLGEGTDTSLDEAEREYAQLCVIKETELTSLPGSPRGDYAARQHLRQLSARLCRQFNEMGAACIDRSAETAHALLQRARTCAATADDDALTVTTLANIGLCWLARRNPTTAAATLRQAVTLDMKHADTLAPVDATDRVRLRLNLCAALCQLGAYAEALAEAEGAAVLAEDLDDVQIALALHNVCVCHEYLGQIGKARAAAERALTLARGQLPEEDVLLRRLAEVAGALAKGRGGE